MCIRDRELSDGGVPRFPSFLRLAEGKAPAPTKPKKKKAAKKTATKKTAVKKKASKATKAAANTTKQPSGGNVETRYFELENDKSSKFWEVTVTGIEVTVRYGRIGANGTSKVKGLKDEAAAQAHADKLIEQKTNKGYVAATP